MKCLPGVYFGPRNNQLKCWDSLDNMYDPDTRSKLQSKWHELVVKNICPMWKITLVSQLLYTYSPL